MYKHMAEYFSQRSFHLISLLTAGAFFSSDIYHITIKYGDHAFDDIMNVGFFCKIGTGIISTIGITGFLTMIEKSGQIEKDMNHPTREGRGKILDALAKFQVLFFLPYFGIIIAYMATDDFTDQRLSLGRKILANLMFLSPLVAAFVFDFKYVKSKSETKNQLSKYAPKKGLDM